MSPDPPQTMDFQSDGRFSSNIQGLEDFDYYLVLQDSIQQILSLYQDPPTAVDRDLENLTHSYNILFTDDGVKLYFRYCFEGCHLGLRPIGQQN